MDPYASTTSQERRKKIRAGGHQLKGTGRRKLNELLRILFEMLLDPDPNQRPSLDAVIGHPVFYKAKEASEMLCDINGT